MLYWKCKHLCRYLPLYLWHGRQLIGIQQSERIGGSLDAVGEGTEIEYNADGIRVFMQTPYAIHYYTVDGSTILEEKMIDSDGERIIQFGEKQFTILMEMSFLVQNMNQV